MSDAQQPTDDAQQRGAGSAQDDSSVQLERSTYQLIRDRLRTNANDLRQRMDQLNELRREVFGSIKTELITTERVNTSNNCIARDIVPVGDQFVFGYNVQIGLRSETKLEDVFSVYRQNENHLTAVKPDLLSSPNFEHDFRQLYKYYKDTRFAKFQVIEPFLYLVFQVGKSPDDIKSFKFQLGDNDLKYLDNRSDHEVKFPSQHDFEWTRTHREQHRGGRHPHISIEDRLFVETIGGDLTIKVEDNTDSGKGVYAEPVDDTDQTLDDAEVFYAIVGNLIALKIRPFKETDYRYLIYCEKNQTVYRLDEISEACVLLPEDHGLIFSSGYILQSGELKKFENNIAHLVFEKKIPSANGEDFLYVFYHPENGHYVLLSYNMIEQQVWTPLICDGFSIFEDGRLICFRTDDSPAKHHALQIWQTPFIGSVVQTAQKTDSYIYKIGNREVVRAMAECTDLINLIGRDDSYANLYVDLAKKANDVSDSYFWLGDPQAFNLKDAVTKIHDAANAAINEFDKVVRIRATTKQQFETVSADANQTISDSQRGPYREIDDFVKILGRLRSIRGKIISLKELRYVDLGAVDDLEISVIEQTEQVSQNCVKFLLQDNALKSYVDRVTTQHESIEGLETATQCKKLDEEILEVANELEMLIDIVSNLKIDDATKRTEIIDNISTIFASLNKTRATLKNKSQSLMSLEGAAEFNSQMKLLSQAIVNYLDHCETPQKCDEYLTKMMVQIEELEGRFSEFDEFLLQLSEKREEVYSAFDTRKLQLIEARNRRATALLQSADRILKGVASRIASFETVDDINSYFASDLMIEKVRDIVEQLDELEEAVKVDEIQSRLKTVREDAVRQLRDRSELFVDGKNIIKFGEFNFTVNTQPLDLTIVIKDDWPCFHLSGTNYFEKIENEQYLQTRHVWDQSLVSENRQVYRGEFLAYQMFVALTDPSSDELSFEEVVELDADQLRVQVQKFMAPRYAEGYVKGVHDQDAANILKALIELKRNLGLLEYSSPARALATLFWNDLEPSTKKNLEAKFKSVSRARDLFGKVSGRQSLVRQIEEMIRAFIDRVGLFEKHLARESARSLLDQLSGLGLFVLSNRANQLRTQFDKYLLDHEGKTAFGTHLKSKTLSVVDRYGIARDWLSSFVDHQDQKLDPHLQDSELVDELAATYVNAHREATVIDAKVESELSGLLGDHHLINQDVYRLNFNHFMNRLNRFDTETVGAFNQFHHLKKRVTDERREELRLEEFHPKVLTSFVRNQLINEIYLPLIGANLAKQIGVAGEEKRTDLMGLLLLISPPGYGKTTLMEYIANRLGITFVKINGPAIGHRVTSLDPVEAPNASAREEVEKLNLALEMGDNVMIYLDDIQHCNPELLQKFISLCDATRRIEGVFKGKTRTYDLRGRKVAVVMAGNPYTESGEKFQIPDMLANRADTYNLGDVIGDKKDSFELSYLENCLTSNPALNILQSRSRNDIYSFIKMAGEDSPQSGSLEGNYSIEEINEIVGVLKKLLVVRDVILNVNREYIDSAAQAEEYRTEPAFRLQGSYRDMNKIAERIVSIMNDQELQTLIISHYENQAQTLTTGAEANLLKFRSLNGLLDTDQQQRWEDICRTFKRNLVLGSAGGDDQLSQIIAQMTTFSDGLHEISRSVQKGVGQLVDSNGDESETMQTATLREVARAVGELAKFNVSLDAIKTTLVESSETIANLPAQVSQQKIEITNKMPNAILNVLRNQFRVLQTWMEPILNLADSLPEGQSLARASKITQKNYERLIDRIEGDEDKSE